jgi:hypothetical protein
MAKKTDLLNWLSGAGGVRSVIVLAACAGLVGCQGGDGERPDRRVGFRPPDSAMGDDLLPPVENGALTIEPDPSSDSSGGGASPQQGNGSAVGIGGNSVSPKREFDNPAWLDEAQKRLQSQSGKTGGDSSAKSEGPAKTEGSKPAGTPKKSPVYAKKVPGKPGVVWNPFVPGEMLDVSDLPPGAEARDPKTGGTFLVP